MEYKYVVDLIRHRMMNTEIQYVKDCNYEKVLDIIRANKLQAFLFGKELFGLSKDKDYLEFVSCLERDCKVLGFRQIIQNRELMRVLSAAYEKGLKLIVFKGIVFSSLYENEYARVSCDADLLIDSLQVNEVIQLLEALGYTHKKQKDNVEELQLQGKLKIELHQKLWEDFQGSKIDALENMNLTSESSLIHKNYKGIDYVTLGYTEQLIYHIYHLVKHFELEGIGIKSLLDLTLYVNAYYDEINQMRFWKSMKCLKYDRFVEALFQLCIAEFGMKKITLRHQFKESEIIELLLDFLNIGKYGEADNGNWCVKDNMAYYLCGDKPKSMIRAKIELLFPDKNSLSDEYEYAKKNGLLLPIAWIHRLINYMKRDDQDERYDTIKKIKKVSTRLKLMKKYGLVK